VLLHDAVVELGVLLVPVAGDGVVLAVDAVCGVARVRGRVDRRRAR
jgi:hypothetical protein